MGRFNFNEFDKLTALEQLCKEWCLLSLQNPGKKERDENILADLKKHHRITEAMREFPPGIITDTANFQSDISPDIYSLEEKQNLIEYLENAWQSLQNPSIRCDWNEYYPESIDTCLRYHDRYYPISLHSHSFFEIVFLVRGECAHRVGDDMIEMQRGDVVIVPPGTLHSVFSFSDKNIIFNMPISSNTFEQNFLSLLVSHNILGEFFRKTLYSKEDRKSYFIIRTGDYFLGDNILADIWREINSDLPYQREMLSAQVKLLLIHLLRYYSDSMFMAMIDSDNSETIVEMMAYIQRNFRDITAEKLSEKFKYSKRQVFRLIQRYAGTTLGRLQQDLRMKHAVRLLTSSDMNVEQIAADCGYNSSNHFYTVFKETYGTTPLEYRKKHLG